jgi:hypothetical protein
VVTTTGREAVDRYETRKSTAEAAHFDKKVYHAESCWRFFSSQFCVTVFVRSTVAEMARMPKVRVGWTCGLHRCIRKTQTLRSSYLSLTATMFEKSRGDPTYKSSDEKPSKLRRRRDSRFEGLPAPHLCDSLLLCRSGSIGQSRSSSRQVILCNAHEHVAKQEACPTSRPRHGLWCSATAQEEEEMQRPED